MTSIRGMLSRTLIIGLGLALLIGGIAVNWIVRTNLTRQFDESLRDRANAVAALIKIERDELVFATDEGPEHTLATTYFEIRSMDGTVLKTSDNLGEHSLLTDALQDDEIRFEDCALPDGGAGRVVAMSFETEIDDDPDEDSEDDEEDEALAIDELDDAAELVVVAAIDRSDLDRALASVVTALLIVGGLLVVLTTALVAAGVRTGLTSLDRLRRQIEHVEGDDMATQFNVDEAPRELIPVYRELNRMFDRVAQTLEREASFADSAAHELRTPLAELRSTTEVALRWPDAERAERTLREVLDIGADMERIVHALLAISQGRLDHSATSITSDEWAALIREAVDRARRTADDKRLSLNVCINPDDGLTLPRDALKIIVRNLVDNAVDYTPMDGNVSVHAGRNGNPATLLTVTNGPVDISSEDIPRLFEPFWRRDAARTDRRHAGLGLAVVCQIAHTIGCDVEADVTDGQLRMRVVLSAHESGSVE